MVHCIVIWCFLVAVNWFIAPIPTIDAVEDITGRQKKLQRRKGKREFLHTPTCSSLIGIYRTLASLETQCGFYLDSVLDIGANSGSWSMDLRRYFPQANFFLIEGSSANIPALSKTGMPFEIAVVGDTDKDVIFYKKDGDTGNSMFKQYNWKNLDENSGTRVKMTTVDAILQRRNVTTAFKFMKVDIQGSEILALKGSTQALQSVEVVAVEASIMNYNIGGASFLNLYATLDSFGFGLYDMFDMMRRREGSLVQIDLLFVRKTSQLWSKECTGIDSSPSS